MSSKYLTAFKELNNADSCKRQKVNKIFSIDFSSSSLCLSRNKQQYLHLHLHASLKCGHFLHVQVLISCYLVSEQYLKKLADFSVKMFSNTVVLFSSKLKHFKICWYKWTPPLKAFSTNIDYCKKVKFVIPYQTSFWHSEMMMLFAFHPFQNHFWNLWHVIHQCSWHDNIT